MDLNIITYLRIAYIESNFGIYVDNFIIIFYKHSEQTKTAR